MALNFGISPALLTPFEAHGVDLRRLAEHAQNALTRGCRTATIFGTTGEGPSVGAVERDHVAARLVSDGFPADRLVEGVIACSIEEAVFSAGRALHRGAHAVLLAPPFYFRPAPEDAVFAWYEAVFVALDRDLRDILLYHIPGMTGVSLSHSVVRRLVDRFPGAVRGVKDSGCDVEATLSLIHAFPDLDILVGDETYLGRACAAGAAGSICGVANVAPEAVIALAENGTDDPRIVTFVQEITRHPVIPMLKAMVAHIKKDQAWAAVRPPLQSVSDAMASRAVTLLEPLQDGVRAVA